jgi:hypothetical protein
LLEPLVFSLRFGLHRFISFRLTMSSALVWAVSAVVLVPLFARRVLTAGAMTPPVANAHRQTGPRPP